jgi:hypothetical protein
MTKRKTWKQVGRLNLKGYRNEGKIGKKYKKIGSWTTETVGNFSVIVDQYLWKRLKNEEEEEEEPLNS